MGITVLGPLSLDESNVRLGRRDRVVLAALAVWPGRAVSDDRLIDALWGDDPPASATKILQGCVVRLRKLLGPDAIQTSAQGYRLSLHDADEVDAQRFERMVVRGRELVSLGEPDRAAYVIKEALSLWQGQPFEELEGWDLATVEAGRLEELRLEAEELRVEASLRAGHHHDVLADAEAMVKAAPLRERRWALLAQAQYQAGRQGEALQTINQVKTMLVERLGLDPGPAMAALEQSILRQDPHLFIDGAIPASGSCPYRGLLAYDVDDAESFFGREAELRSCLAVVRRTSVLAVVGPSGSGKSSLVRAGVAASLRAEHHVRILTPGPRPIQTLTAVPVSGPRQVLVVDQCEEVFSLCANPAEQTEFLGALERHAEIGLLVVALRADRLADVAKHPGFARLVERGLHLLGAMDEEDLRKAIESPARQAGLLIEPGLVDLLLREVMDEPGALPLLSHALVETWKRREANTLTVAAYRATGGIRGAVAQSAEGVYARIDEGQRNLLRDLVLRLVAPGVEGEPVRSRVPRRLVATDADHDRLIDLLVSSRLVTSDDGVVEIAHEALARAWPRLRAWLDDDVEGQRILHHLTAAADAWDALGRPESELYRGVRLTQTLEWRTCRGTVLTSTETAFLDAAERVADSEQRAAQKRVRQQARMIRRLLGVLAGAGVFLLAAVLAGTLAVRQADRADTNARAAEVSAVAADARRLGAQALASQDIDESMLLAVAGVQLDDLPETRSSLLAVLGKHPTLIGSVQMQGSAVRELDVSPDGNTVATRDSKHHVRLYDIRSGEQLAEYQAGVTTPLRAEVGGIRFSPDGRMIAVGMAPLSRRPVTLLDAATLEPLPVQLVDLPDRRWSTIDVTFSADGRSVAAALWRIEGTGDDLRTTSGSAGVWRLRSERSPVLRPLSGDWHDVALSPDGGLLYTTGPFTIYDLAAEKTLSTPHVSGLLGLETSPDGDLVATAKEYGEQVLLLDAETGVVRRRLPGIAGEELVDVRFSGDGQLLASVTWTNHVAVVWDVNSGEQRTEVQLTVGGESVDFSPDGTTLYTAGYDAALRRWDLAGSRQFISRVPVSKPPPQSGFVIPAPGAEFVAYFSFRAAERRLTFLNVQTGEAGPLLDKGPGFTLNGGSWHPNGYSFATAKRGTVRVWDARTGTITVEGHPSGRYVTDGDYSTDGSRIAISELSGRVTMLNAATLEPVGRPVRLPDSVCCVSAGPDNRTAIALTGGAKESQSGFWQAPVTGWALVDLVSGEVLGTGRLHGVNGLWVAFSPNGTAAAVAGSDGELLILDLETGGAVRPPVVGHNGGVFWLTYSPDGSQILTGSSDANIGMWDASSGELLARAVLPNRFAVGQFLPDGHSVLIAQYGGDVYEWNTSVGYAVDFACQVAGRDFTQTEWQDSFGDRPYQETCPVG